MVDGKSSHGGYCGPAVKPIALNMVQQMQGDREAMLPLSGIGGIATWRDAAEFILLGCGNVQVCTAAMHYGYRIVEDMADGLLEWMGSKGFETIAEFRGLSAAERARVEAPEPELPRGGEDSCGQVHRLPALLYGLLGWGAPVHSSGSRQRRFAGVTAWERSAVYASRGESAWQAYAGDGVCGVGEGHYDDADPEAGLTSNGGGPAVLQSVTPLERIPRVDADECVGCNLCSLVCPVEDCITMERVENGLGFQSWEERVAAGTVPVGASPAGFAEGH